jgi:hypothetical protein
MLKAVKANLAKNWPQYVKILSVIGLFVFVNWAYYKMLSLVLDITWLCTLAFLTSWYLLIRKIVV